jgi:hypothetical protein
LCSPFQQWAEKFNVARATGDEKRGKSPLEDNGVTVSLMSSLITNGDVEIVAGTLFFLQAAPISRSSSP